MALYAVDEEILETVYAGNAVERKTYRCSGCNGPVRVRKGPHRLPHFYHLSRAPSCRLYSKSEDHLLAQLFLKKILPPGETTLEKPFPSILRVADVAWESQQIVFEIQCSQCSLKEASQRIEDYSSLGYQVVWILDDRIFNRRFLRPAEAYIRNTPCYYASLRKQVSPLFYDQFEVVESERRIKKGRKLRVQLNKPMQLPQRDWEEMLFPKQVLKKVTSCQLYFYGDLLHKATLSAAVPALDFAMQNFRFLETFYSLQFKKERSILKKILRRWILRPYGHLMLHLLKWAIRT